jgi:hypothetical protein
MPLPNFITKIFSGGASGLVDSITGAVDKLTLSKEEAAQFKETLLKETNRHMEALGTLAQTETDSYLKDMDSARQMQISALAQDDHFSKRFVYFLAAGLILLTFIFDILFFFINYPERNHDIVNMIAGVLNTVGFASVVSFFFGSSAGSHSKQKQLDQLSKPS